MDDFLTEEYIESTFGGLTECWPTKEPACDSLPCFRTYCSYDFVKCLCILTYLIVRSHPAVSSTSSKALNVEQTNVQLVFFCVLGTFIKHLCFVTTVDIMFGGSITDIICVTFMIWSSLASSFSVT